MGPHWTEVTDLKRLLEISVVEERWHSNKCNSLLEDKDHHLMLVHSNTENFGTELVGQKLTEMNTAGLDIGALLEWHSTICVIFGGTNTPSPRRTSKNRSLWNGSSWTEVNDLADGENGWR